MFMIMRMLIDDDYDGDYNYIRDDSDYTNERSHDLDGNSDDCSRMMASRPWAGAQFDAACDVQ